MSFLWLGLLCLTPLSTIFQLCRDSQFYWWSTRRKQPTCRKSLTYFITYGVHLAMSGVQTRTTLMQIVVNPTTKRHDHDGYLSFLLLGLRVIIVAHDYCISFHQNNPKKKGRKSLIFKFLQYKLHSTCFLLLFLFLFLVPYRRSRRGL